MDCKQKMIYAPGKFAFIHIPRTGGYSIKSAVQSTILEHYAVTINRQPRRDGVWCHSTADELSREIPDWDRIFKFAIMRNPHDLVRSMWNWVQKYKPDEHFDFSTFIQRPGWPIPEGGFHYHYCGNEKVRVIPFESLKEAWPGLCSIMDISMDTELPHINGLGKLPELSDEDAEVIYQKCKRDFSLFDYPRNSYN